MADHSKEIAELREILNSGATSVTVDGIQTSYDHDSIRRRLQDLLAEQDDPYQRAKKPVVSTILLNHPRP